jgi:hypothetical protein
MLSVLANSEPHSILRLLGGGLLAAPSMSVPVAIVLFGVLLGLAITLSPSRRTSEIKRPKDE